MYLVFFLSYITFFSSFVKLHSLINVHLTWLTFTEGNRCWEATACHLHNDFVRMDDRTRRTADCNDLKSICSRPEESLFIDHIPLKRKRSRYLTTSSPLLLKTIVDPLSSLVNPGQTSIHPNY